MQRNIVVLVTEKAHLLTLASFTEAFALVDMVYGGPHPDGYVLWIASRDGGGVVTSSGYSLSATPLAELPSQLDTLILSGGYGYETAVKDQALISWIATRRPTIRRVGTLGSGIYLAAAAGLLAGRRVVTHWRLLEGFRKIYPDISVSADALFIQDRGVWSSPGMSASTDLALALIDDDLGRKFSVEVAQSLIVFAKRSGGQPQLSTALRTQAAERTSLEMLYEWISTNLHLPLSVEMLAEKAGMSVRNFARLHKSSIGMTPAKTIEKLRLEAACRALDQSTLQIAEIALRFGFGNEERMRRTFIRILGTPPAAYRSGQERFSKKGQDRANHPAS